LELRISSVFLQTEEALPIINIMENIMKSYIFCKFAACAVLSLMASVPASAQSIKDQLVGAWSLVSNVEEYSYGKTVSCDQGAKCRLDLDAKGRFMVMINQVAPRKKVEGNPADFPVGKMVSYYGTYTVNEDSKTLTYKIDSASFPAWDGAEQTRLISTINGSDLLYKSMTPIPSAQGPFVTVISWKRMP
jgi:hypothetical protein